jgi:hypothetical protein
VLQNSLVGPGLAEVRPALQRQQGLALLQAHLQVSAGQRPVLAGVASTAVVILGVSSMAGFRNESLQHSPLSIGVGPSLASVAGVGATVKASNHRRDELRWRFANKQELQTKYAGSWVALEGERVVAHGTDAAAVVKEARSKGVRTPYVFFVEPPRPGVVWLGL